MVYGCDGPWWRHRRGLPEYTGLKVCWSGNGLDGFPDIRRIEIAKVDKHKYSTDLEMDRPGEVIGGGGNSGFQAMNLAVQFGAKRILLIGFDMTDRGGVHWYGRNHWLNANNPMGSNFERWLAAFERAKPVLDGLGVQVVNCSPLSAMKTFPRRSIDDALKGWA